MINKVEIVLAVAAGDQGLMSSGSEVSLESHLMAFAVEKIRLECKAIDPKDFSI